MTRNEALKAAIDGKKIQMTHWDKKQYVRFDNEIGKFCYWDGCQSFLTHAMVGNDIRDKNGIWQIVHETVSFAEAWKAYEQGKRIKSVKWSETEMKLPYIHNSHEKHCPVSLRASEIRGQWMILENNND